MSSNAPGWYPDPGGDGQLRYFDGYQWTEHAHPPPRAGIATDGKRSSRRALPAWAWALIAAALASLVLSAVVKVVMIKHMPPLPATPSANSSAPQSSPPPRSGVIPELQFPAGATRRNYTSHEFWDVPLAYSDTVEAIRPQLPISRPYHGLAWCDEFIRQGELTSWSWGDEADYLTVRVKPHSDGSTGSEVTVSREPHPSGCRR